MDGSVSGYLKSVGDYVHLNQARAKRVAAEHYGEERAGRRRRRCGDDDDGGVDSRASGDGPARLSEPSLVSLEAGRGVVNIKNCPLYC